MFRLLLTLLAIGFVLYGLILFGPGQQLTKEMLPAPLADAVRSLREHALEPEPASLTNHDAAPAAASTVDPQVAKERTVAQASPEYKAPKPRLDALPPLPPLPPQESTLPSQEPTPTPEHRASFIRNRPVPTHGAPPDLTAADVLQSRPIASSRTRPTPAPTASPAAPMPPAPMPKPNTAPPDWIAQAPRYESKRSTDEVFSLNRKNAELFDQLADLFE